MPVPCLSRALPRKEQPCLLLDPSSPAAQRAIAVPAPSGALINAVVCVSAASRVLSLPCFAITYINVIPCTSLHTGQLVQAEHLSCRDWGLSAVAPHHVERESINGILGCLQ